MDKSLRHHYRVKMCFQFRCEWTVITTVSANDTEETHIHQNIQSNSSPPSKKSHSVKQSSQYQDRSYQEVPLFAVHNPLHYCSSMTLALFNHILCPQDLVKFEELSIVILQSHVHYPYSRLLHNEVLNLACINFPLI